MWRHSQVLRAMDTAEPDMIPGTYDMGRPTWNVQPQSVTVFLDLKLVLILNILHQCGSFTYCSFVTRALGRDFQYLLETFSRSRIDWPLPAKTTTLKQPRKLYQPCWWLYFQTMKVLHWSPDAYVCDLYPYFLHCSWEPPWQESFHPLKSKPPWSLGLSKTLNVEMSCNKLGLLSIHHD